jgi:hypothetical protein
VVRLVRSGLVRLGPVGLVRSVRCVYEDTRTGPIPRTKERTEQRQASPSQSQGQQSQELPLDAHRGHFGDQLNG